MIKIIAEQINPVDYIRSTLEHDQLCLIRLSIFGHFDTFPGVGGWVDGWGKIENKDHLSQAKAEIGAELRNIDGLFLLFKSQKSSSE